ncbi:hypothetical protein H4Q26_006781 [Puccinia striiformis f. sp. tritici PST-130]|nr:hypothetical protein H4Q26_006781 [Puccinia striiformis f. sp. tritici PST-130]
MPIYVTTEAVEQPPERLAEQSGIRMLMGTHDIRRQQPGRATPRLPIAISLSIPPTLQPRPLASLYLVVLLTIVTGRIALLLGLPRGELDDAFNQLFQIHSPTASSLGRSVRNIASIYLRHFIKPSVDCLWFRLWTIYILLPNLSLACNQSIPLQLPAKLVIRLFVVSLSIAHTG